MTTKGLAGLNRLSSTTDLPDKDIVAVVRSRDILDSAIPIGRLEEGATAASPRWIDTRHQWEHFKQSALMLYDRGWMPVPQTRHGKRLPGRHNGRVIKWGDYASERAPRELVEAWTKDYECWSDNAAVILGEPSGNAFVFDVDITDEDLAAKAKDIVIDELGETMSREGNWPKEAFVYRVENADDIPHTGKFILADANGRATDHMIEVLGRRHMVTFVGVHHSTGRLFTWAGGVPQAKGPKDVTTVTPAQLQRCYDRLASELNLNVPPRAQPGAIVIDEEAAGNMRVPHIAAWSGASWIEQDGKVFDGRDAYLWSLVKETVKRNPAAPAESIHAVVIETFRREEREDKRWLDSRLLAETKDKTFRAMAMLADGRIKAVGNRSVRVGDDGETTVEILAPIESKSGKARSTTNALGFLPTRRAAIPVQFTSPEPEKAAQRAIVDNRDEATDRAAQQVLAGVDAFINGVMGDDGTVHIIDGPTGVGKSSMALRRLAERMEEIRDAVALLPPIEDKPRGPITFLVLTYANVDDLRSKASMLQLDATATDEDLIAAAAEAGLVPAENVDDYLEQLRRFGIGADLRTMTYEGKVKAGCFRADEMRELQKAGIPSSGLCSKTVSIFDSQGRPTGEKEERTCPFYASCQAIAQRERLKEMDLVFLVKNFLVLAIPSELKHPAGLIIDEAFHDLLIKTATMPLTALETARKEPRLTKDEKKAGMSPLDILRDRDAAAAMATAGLKLGHDLPQIFADHVDGKITGMHLIESARRVTGHAMTSQAELNPELTLEEIKDLCARPAGSFIGEEYRFWKLLEEQVQVRINRKLDCTVEVPDDQRIRLVDGDTEAPSLQLSWLVDPNWKGVPTLLLDASSDEVITSIILGDRVIKRHPVDVSLNQDVVVAPDRRLAVSNFFVGKDASAQDKMHAASSLASVRAMIAVQSAQHAHGRVLFVVPLKLRRAVLFNWAPPANADFRHYGPIAGLDFARRHVSVQMISRMELPTREVDGMTAALGHARGSKEILLDPLGTGKDDGGKDIYPNVVRHEQPMRDGGTAKWDKAAHAGELAGRIQRQYREMGLMQAAGRGRTVYREDAPTIVIASEAVPENMIVDEVVGFDDLSGLMTYLFDAARLCGGLIEANMLAHFAPHLGNAAAFQQYIDLFIEGNDLVRSRYHSIVAELSDGTRRKIYAPGHMTGWKHRVGETLKIMGLSGMLREAVPCQCTTVAAEAPAPDKVEMIIAAMDAQAAELAELDRLADVVIARGEWCLKQAHKGNDVPKVFRAGEGDMEKCSGTLGAFVALKAIEDEWVRTGRMDEKRARELGLIDVVETTDQAKQAVAA